MAKHTRHIVLNSALSSDNIQEAVSNYLVEYADGDFVQYADSNPESWINTDAEPLGYGSISDLISYGSVSFTNGSKAYRLFTPSDFINTSWSASTITRKTQSTQLVDYACMFRLMRSNSMATLTIKQTTGYINFRIYSSDGLISREIESNASPILNTNVAIGMSWDAINKVASLSVFDITNHNIIFAGSSSTQIPSSGWTEVDGLHIGNRADGTLQYIGNVYGVSLNYGNSLSANEMNSLFSDNKYISPLSFDFKPKISGLIGSATISEPHGINMTVECTNINAFWGI